MRFRLEPPAARTAYRGEGLRAGPARPGSPFRRLDENPAYRKASPASLAAAARASPARGRRPAAGRRPGGFGGEPGGLAVRERRSPAQRRGSQGGIPAALLRGRSPAVLPDRWAARETGDPNGGGPVGGGHAPME